MKKLFIAFAFAAALFTACAKTEQPVEMQAPAQDMSMSVSTTTADVPAAPAQ